MTEKSMNIPKGWVRESGKVQQKIRESTHDWSQKSWKSPGQID